MRLFVVVRQYDVTHPRSSMRCSAGYSDPWPILNTSPESSWIRALIPHPWNDSTDNALRMSRSRVPCTTSRDFGILSSVLSSDECASSMSTRGARCRVGVSGARCFAVLGREGVRRGAHAFEQRAIPPVRLGESMLVTDAAPDHAQRRACLIARLCALRIANRVGAWPVGIEEAE